MRRLSSKRPKFALASRKGYCLPFRSDTTSCTILPLKHTSSTQVGQLCSSYSSKPFQKLLLIRNISCKKKGPSQPSIPKPQDAAKSNFTSYPNPKSLTQRKISVGFQSSRLDVNNYS